MTTRNSLAADANRLRLGDKFQAELELAKGEILEAKNEHNNAQAVYDSLTSSSDPLVKSWATLGVARCELLKDNPSRAEAKFKQVANDKRLDMDDPTARRILASAWNGIGAVIREKAADQKLALDEREALLHDALRAFLRGALLYVPEQGTGSPEHAQALYYAGLCYDNLRKFVDPREQEEEYRRRALRALELYQKVMDQYPGSSWASDAAAKRNAILR